MDMIIRFEDGNKIKIEEVDSVYFVDKNIQIVSSSGSVFYKRKEIFSIMTLEGRMEIIFKKGNSICVDILYIGEDNLYSYFREFSIADIEKILY